MDIGIYVIEHNHGQGDYHGQIPLYEDDAPFHLLTICFSEPISIDVLLHREQPPMDYVHPASGTAPGGIVVGVYGAGGADPFLFQPDSSPESSGRGASSQSSTVTEGTMPSFVGSPPYEDTSAIPSPGQDLSMEPGISMVNVTVYPEFQSPALQKLKGHSP